MSLTFAHLREVNANRDREVFEQCSDWQATDWMTAIAGEVGELANFIKKARRGDFDENHGSFLQEAAREGADIVIYLDLLFDYLGLDLGEAVQQKFNETSEKRGSSYRL